MEARCEQVNILTSPRLPGPRVSYKKRAAMGGLMCGRDLQMSCGSGPNNILSCSILSGVSKRDPQSTELVMFLRLQKA